MNSVMRLQLMHYAGELNDINILLARPQAFSLLIGKKPEVVKQLVPMLFSLCANAQGIAAEVAMNAAIGIEINDSERNRLAFRVKQEIVAEHAWRLLLDWPKALGRIPVLERQCAQYRRLILAATDHVAFKSNMTEMWVSLMQLPAQVFLAMTVNEWSCWLQETTAPMALLLKRLQGLEISSKQTVDLLPATTAKDWGLADGALMSSEFCRNPDRQGQVLQTGVLVRRGHFHLVSSLVTQGLLVEARLLAKVVELAVWVTQYEDAAVDWVDAGQIETGVGVARVETSRGTLVHQVRLEGDVVREYAILAPTEWNFHPQGAFTQEIKSMVSKDNSIVERAKILALSLDPCVAFEVETAYA